VDLWGPWIDEEISLMVMMKKRKNGDPASNKAANENERKRERKRERAPHGIKKSKHVTLLSVCLSVCKGAQEGKSSVEMASDPWRRSLCMTAIQQPATSP